MKKLLIALLACVLGATAAHAQKTKAQISTEITTLFPDNTIGAITPTALRTVTNDIAISIMPTAPVVANNTACFEGTTGLLKDCGVAPSLLIVGTTAVSSGISNGLLYNNGGILANTVAAQGGLLNTNAFGVPAVTATPVLGVTGSVVGSLGFQNLTSGTVSLQAQTGALGASVVSLPAITDTLVGRANAETLTNKIINGAGNTLTVLAPSQLSGSVPLGNGGTGQTTAPTSRSTSGLNIDSFTGHGDSIYTILPTDRVVGTNASLTASRTWTLPAANAVNAGQVLVVADFSGTVTGANTLVIARAGSDTVNGGTSVTISSANGGYSLWSDGTSKWSAQAIGASALGSVTSIAGNSGAFTLANGIDNSVNQIQLTAARRTLPTRQVFLSGSGTYTTPANVLWVRIRVVGGGSGGGGGNSSTPSTGGGASTFSGGTLSAAGGGTASAVSGPSAGGAASGGNLLNIPGGSGQGSAGTLNAVGGMGGSSCLGGAGAGAAGATSGSAAAANSGSGGGGGGGGSTASIAGGGAAGGCVEHIITSPAASYTYAVGTGGAGATGTTAGSGGAGAAGIVIVEEHYGS